MVADAPPVYSHRGTRAVQRMVEYAPSTGGLALWVRHQDLPADAGGPPVATDGTVVRYAASFDRLPLAEQAGWVAHEVLHIALRHPQRQADLQRVLGDVDAQLFNLCADAIVNSTIGHLSWLELARTAVHLDRLLSVSLGIDQAVEKSLLEWDVERLYRAIDDRRSRPQASGGRNRREPGQGSGAREDGPRAARARALGAHSPPDLLPATPSDGAPEAQAEQAREWSERILRAHANDGDFSMLRALIADLPGSRTPWEQVLRTQLARALSTRPGISWSRPARSYLANQGRVGTNGRLPWEPGFSGTKRVPRLVLVVDVSGSIDDRLMERFAVEIEAITRRLEAGVVLVIGDDRVRRVERFDPGRCTLQGIDFQGGGGTDFTPLLEEADRHRPDITVVLTDLDGPARVRPRWPVLWAVPEANAPAVPPFGRRLLLR
jgi:hypothetical protein